jgi:hypothetical protein
MSFANTNCDTIPGSEKSVVNRDDDSRGGSSSYRDRFQGCSPPRLGNVCQQQPLERIVRLLIRYPLICCKMTQFFIGLIDATSGFCCFLGLFDS